VAVACSAVESKAVESRASVVASKEVEGMVEPRGVTLVV
jgi:hypothetical protein